MTMHLLMPTCQISYLHGGFALMLQQWLLSTCGAHPMSLRIYTLPTLRHMRTASITYAWPHHGLTAFII
jgi:hypothetical protein